MRNLVEGAGDRALVAAVVAMARGCDAADVPIAMSFGRCVPLRFEVVAEEYVAALAGSAVLAGAAAAARAPSAHALSGTAT